MIDRRYLNFCWCLQCNHVFPNFNAFHILFFVCDYRDWLEDVKGKKLNWNHLAFLNNMFIIRHCVTTLQVHLFWTQQQLHKTNLNLIFIYMYCSHWWQPTACLIQSDNAVSTAGSVPIFPLQEHFYYMEQF